VKRIIFSSVIVLMLVMMALLAANLLPMGAQPTEPKDFGDAPSPYPTLLTDNGACHNVSGIYLGATIDWELDGQPNSTATGDDSNNLTDEDGVVFTTPLVKGQSANVTVTASAAGYLDAWVDFNDDGDWADAGEQIFTSQLLNAGANNLNFTVANGATDDQTFARFRFSSAGGLSYVGPAADGEVEDYQVTLNEVLSLECLASANTTNVGQAINWTACAAGGVPPYSWLWTVNGTPVASFNDTACINFSYAFNETGFYTVCVNVTDSWGYMDGPCCTNVTVIGALNLTCDVNPNPTKVGHVTNFTATASGAVGNYTWLWTVNGTPVPGGQNTTYNFTADGIYTVCVNVTVSSGNTTQCCKNVTVNPPLSLECLVSANTTKVGQAINCNATAWGGVPPYSWLWTVNGTPVASFNNTTSTNITYTFNTSGIYNVCVNVTDSLGNKEGCCTNVTVSEALNLTCDVSPNPTKVGHVTNFTAIASGAVGNYTWLWTANGTPVPGAQNTTYNFTADGIYTVCVNVTVSPGNTTQCCTNVTVNEKLSLECLVSSNTTKVGQAINCTACAAGGVPPYSWLWTVDDVDASFNNTTCTNITPTFNTTGIHEVCVNVTDSLGNNKQCCRNITVSEALNLTCDVSPNPTKVGHVTNFTAEASGGVGNYTWLWTVNGTLVPGGQNTTYPFPVGNYTAGIYTVCVNVTDYSGNTTQCCKNVTVNEPLSLECLVSPNTTTVGQVINCIAGASGGVGNYTWLWTADDGWSAGVQNTTHAFNTTGIHEVCINVTDSLGNNKQCCRNITVTCEVPTAEFSGSPRSGCAPLTVVFTDLSTGNATSWSWTFTGGNASGVTGKGPHTVTYTSPGTYTVSLNVSNACDSDTETKTGYITAQDCAPVPPAAGGGGGGCCCYKYLTVDWEGLNTSKSLYSNGRLTQDLLGPSPDGKHSLLLEQGTHAPTVDGQTYYLIVVRELEETPPLPENTRAIVAVNITPTGAVFDRDIFLTLGFAQSQLPENALNVTIAYYDDVKGVWVPLESTQDKRDSMLTMSATLRHLAIFAVLVEVAPPPPPQPAHFVASGLSIEPSVEKIWETVTFVTKTGESVNITATIANDGGQSGTYTVLLKLDGETADTKIVTLGAGQSQQVKFTQSGLGYGQHEMEVAGLSDKFTTSRTITWWLIIVIIVAIGLIIWGVIWGRRRRRRAAQERRAVQGRTRRRRVAQEK
jgi:PKD repeat protein